MALTSQDVVKKQLARGIDSYSARSNLLDGYAEDILNADATSSGQLKKRKGYEGYRGRLPLRVKSMYHSAEYIYLTFDDSQAIDLSGIGSCPIVVQGRLNVLDGPNNVSYTDGYYRGDFGAINQVRYYDSFEVSNRNVVAVGTNTYSFDADTTGIASKYAFMGLGMAGGASTTSHDVLGLSNIKVNESTFAVQLEFDSAETGTSFFYYIDKAAEAGVTHIETVAAQTSVSITATTHGLSNYSIGVRCFDTDVEAGYLTEVMPNLVSISSTGTVAVTFDSAFTGFIICTACPILNVTSATVTGGATETISVSVDQPFNFYYCYAQVGSTYESVLPSNIAYDETTSTTSIEFVAPPSAETVFIYHEEADSVANRIKLRDTHVYTFTAAVSDTCTAVDHEFANTAPVRLTTTGTLPAGLSTSTTYYVRDVSGDTFKLESSVGGGAINITATGTGTHTISIYEGYIGTHPQLTVWGIPHEGIYKDATLKGGWVQHIDNYKSATDEFLVAGIGGSFYKELSQADGASSYLIPDSSIQLRGRVESGPVTIAPLFAGTGRTRGVITDASISNYKATVTAAAYVSSGVVDYTLSFTSKTGTIASCIATSIDKLTVSNMPHSALNGSFVISSVQSESATAAVIRCANSGVLNTTLDTAGCAGLAGVFTDLLTLEEIHRFIPGDVIRSTGISSSYTITAIGGGTTSNLYVSGVTAPITLPDGLAIYGRRTGALLPVQNSANVFSSVNFVRGDMLQVGSTGYYPRIEKINVEADTTLASLSGDGTTATATTTAANTYAVGDKVLIYNSANFAGEHEITAVTSDTVFTFAHTYSGSGSGTIQGYTLQIDSDIEFNDYLSPDDVTVLGRWVPIENPANSGSYVYDSTAVPQYPISTAYHWTANAYDNQPVVRSAMVADNMYVTNGYDEVMKIDGSNIYRAGLPAWQPQLFAQVDTTTPSILKGYSEEYLDAVIAGKYFKMTQTTFKAGDRVYDSYSQRIYTVVEVALDYASGTHQHLIVAEDASGMDETPSAERLTLVKTYKYYARLNMIDANDNVIASAATGHNDCIVELVADGQIHHKLVMPPAFGAYDYDRIEVELYRTVANTDGPFYLVKRVTANFDNYSGYIEIDDGTADSFLVDTDVVHGIIKAGELGVNFEAPPRAKHITSAANRLILGNIKSYPQIDITMRPTTTSLTATDLDGFYLLFRQDNTSSTSTTTEYNDAIKFIFRNSAAVTIDATADFSCTSTSFTIKEDAHGLAAGDWVYLFHSAEGTNNDLKYAGWYRVNAVDTAASPDTFTCLRNETLSTFTFTAAVNDTITAVAHGLANGDIVTVASATTLPAGLTAATNYYVINAATDTFKLSATSGGAAVNITDTGTGVHTATVCLKGTANHVNRYVTCTSSQNEKNIPVWLGTDGNYNQKDGNTTGSIEYTAAIRLSNAINAISRNKYSLEHTEGDVGSIYAQWMLARGGNDKALGQVVVEAARVLSTTPEVVVGTVPSNLEIYVNNIKRTSDEQVSAVTYVHPSRVVISYENYPEIFEAVNADSLNSNSVVDVNAADGQEIMGLIPFFGDSTFGQGSLDQVVVVFKENSIYLLDVVSRDYKKIDSRGLGCAAPNSIAPSKNGIIFANKAGIYRLNRDMSISPVGKMMDGFWKDDVTLDSIANAYATNYAFNSQYKLSLPVNSSASNSEVYVYNYDTEGQGQEYGAWTRYDAHPATGWANKDDTAFMATTGGDVMYVKTTEENEAYRDDAAAIATSIILKAEDFDIPASRKVVRSLSTQMAYPDNCTGLEVLTAVNLSSSFESAGSITDTTGEDLNILASPAKRKCNYIQAKYTHSTKDEGFTISGVSYDVARLDTRGSTKMADKG